MIEELEKAMYNKKLSSIARMQETLLNKDDNYKKYRSQQISFTSKRYQQAISEDVKRNTAKKYQKDC